MKQTSKIKNNPADPSLECKVANHWVLYNWDSPAEDILFCAARCDCVPFCIKQ